MKTQPFLIRVACVVAAVATLSLGTSCMTTYDAYGRPVQSVDPGVAVAGAAAAGLAGYAIANNRDRHHYHHRSHYHRGYYYRHRGHYHRY